MKRVVYAQYAHKSAVLQFKSVMSEDEYNYLTNCIEYMEDNNLPFEVIKWDKRANTISLIDCQGWDELYEPIVRDSYLFNVNLNLNDDEVEFVKKVKGGTTVYHRKHEFVNPDYSGFSIENSKERTELLESIPEIHNNKNRIGSVRIWNELLKKYGLPKYMRV